SRHFSSPHPPTPACRAGERSATTPPRRSPLSTSPSPHPARPPDSCLLPSCASRSRSPSHAGLAFSLLLDSLVSSTASAAMVAPSGEKGAGGGARKLKGLPGTTTLGTLAASPGISKGKIP